MSGFQLLKLFLVAGVTLGVVIGTAYAMVPVMTFFGIITAVVVIYSWTRQETKGVNKK